ncbi:MAG: DNA repair protein RecN [Ruminococcaceae bacterium]|nr:DNA repair protein RecN [Oscillospiraceae bacterium]
MLKYLHIENIAVIESASIEPDLGFNVLTGETGAGKSIIIDSINAVLGERTSKDIIRSGADKALVSAVFSDLSDAALSVLNENGISPDEDGLVMVQRQLSLKSNGSIRINGQVVTAQVLRDISKFLVNIHGQHDSQMLLKPENHYIYLDLVADNEKEISDYREAFGTFTSIRRQIKELECDEDKKYERIDLLNFQINELETADIKVGETEQLKKTRELIRNSEKLIKALSDCSYMLNGDIDSDGAISLARSAQSFIEKVSADELSDTAKLLSESIDGLDTVADTIRSFIADFPYSKEEAEKTDERLDTINRIMLKYGNSEASALEYLEKAKAELLQIQFSEETLERLEGELQNAQQRLVSAGEKLTQSRVKAANKFANEVCESLKFMDMSGVRFIVDIGKAKYSVNGCDSVEFLISANAGESVKPLSKVASGGELSRIMLAIKGIIADRDNVDTLIFDEIDTGISGRAASKVAVQLKNVSKLRQVICVTHLAQIAAAAESHFLIEKNVKNGKTYTEVTLLGQDDRVKEIARIMSGTVLSENTISSAKELLDRSKNQ